MIGRPLSDFYPDMGFSEITGQISYAFEYGSCSFGSALCQPQYYGLIVTATGFGASQASTLVTFVVEYSQGTRSLSVLGFSSY